MLRKINVYSPDESVKLLKYSVKLLIFSVFFIQSCLQVRFGHLFWSYELASKTGNSPRIVEFPAGRIFLKFLKLLSLPTTWSGDLNTRLVRILNGGNLFRCSMLFLNAIRIPNSPTIWKLNKWKEVGPLDRNWMTEKINTGWPNYYYHTIEP